MGVFLIIAYVVIAALMARHAVRYGAATGEFDLEDPMQVVALGAMALAAGAVWPFVISAGVLVRLVRREASRD
jgi:hypothetical protein